MCVFGVYTNLGKDPDLKITKHVIQVLEKRGVEYYLEKSLAQAMGLDKAAEDSAFDVLLVLGGDGTMLGAARRYAPHGTLIFGLNLGRVGFLLDTEISSLEAAVDGILEGNYQVEERLMLSASVMGADGVTQKAHAYALNEAVVSQKRILRLIHVDVRVNGLPVDKYYCDGIIVCSPTGSTGYSLSAGGPIVMPSLDVMVINPVCPHTLKSSKMVISGEDVVTILPKHDAKYSTLTLDGQNSFDMEPGDFVKIQRAPFRARFLRFTNKGFFSLLNEKLAEWTSN